MSTSALPVPAGPQRPPATRPTTEQLAAFRIQLLEQRGFRTEQLRGLCLARARGSRSSREITSSLLAGARSALREVTAALQRLDDGSYGRCTACGEQVSLERLEVLPQVAMCMPCQGAGDLSRPPS